MNWKFEGMHSCKKLLESCRYGGFRSGISTGDRQEFIPWKCLCYGLLRKRKMKSFEKESLIEIFPAHKTVLQDLVHIRMVQSALTDT